MVTDLRAVILAECDKIAACLVDLRAIAGIDRELTHDEQHRVHELTEMIHGAERSIFRAYCDAEMSTAGYVLTPDGWRHRDRARHPDERHEYGKEDGSGGTYYTPCNCTECRQATLLIGRR